MLKANVKKAKTIVADLLQLVRDIKVNGRELKYLQDRKCPLRNKIRIKKVEGEVLRRALS